MITKKLIKLFQSLFKGREDVYARRWEKQDRSGYMPAYGVDRSLPEGDLRYGKIF